MVLSFPFSLGFGFMCVLGSIMSFSSCHWLGVWLGLEINVMGFVPLMLQGLGSQSVESAIKYFVIQALGSGFILMGGFGLSDSYIFWYTSPIVSFLGVLCFFGLVLKLGVAPVHWWVPSVMGGLGWFSCGVLLTWQKVAPFFVLLSLSSSFLFLFFTFSVTSALLGGLMGVGQVQLRFLMAYSSIAHWGWILSVAAFSFIGCSCYYFIYFLLSGFIFYFLSCVGVSRISQVGSFSFYFLVVGFMSLAGLPPLSGFVSKWVGLQILGSCDAFFLFVPLILGSLLSLYYYLSFLFVIFLSLGFAYKNFSAKFVSFSVPVGLLVFIGGFPFYEVFFYVL